MIKVKTVTEMAEIRNGTNIGGYHAVVDDDGDVVAIFAYDNEAEDYRDENEPSWQIISNFRLTFTKKEED